MGCGLRDLERFWSGRTWTDPKFHTGPTRRGPRAALSDASSWALVLTAGTDSGNRSKRRSRRPSTGLFLLPVPLATGRPWCGHVTACEGTVVTTQPNLAPKSWCQQVQPGSSRMSSQHEQNQTNKPGQQNQNPNQKPGQQQSQNPKPGQQQGGGHKPGQQEPNR